MYWASLLTGCSGTALPRVGAPVGSGPRATVLVVRNRLSTPVR